MSFPTMILKFNQKFMSSIQVSLFDLNGRLFACLFVDAFVRKSVRSMHGMLGLCVSWSALRGILNFVSCFYLYDVARMPTLHAAVPVCASDLYAGNDPKQDTDCVAAHGPAASEGRCERCSCESVGAVNPCNVCHSVVCNFRAVSVAFRLVGMNQCAYSHTLESWFHARMHVRRRTAYHPQRCLYGTFAADRAVALQRQHQKPSSTDDLRGRGAQLYASSSNF